MRSSISSLDGSSLAAVREMSLNVKRNSARRLSAADELVEKEYAC